MQTRLSVNINDETAADLRELAAKHETTITEIVRRSVSAYAFLKRETEDPNIELQLHQERPLRRPEVTTLALL